MENFKPVVSQRSNIDYCPHDRRAVGGNIASVRLLSTEETKWHEGGLSLGHSAVEPEQRDY
jgi:hypothetical protein